MKRILPIILALALMLCACGKEAPAETTQPAAPAAPETLPAETQEAEGILDPNTRIVYLLVRTIVTNDAGQELSGKEFAYDSQGFCVSERQYSNIGGAGYTCLHTPDAQGRILSSAYTEPDGSQYTIDYIYDGNGMVIRQTVTREYNTERTEFTYDEHGNQLTLMQYLDDELTMDYSFSYTYDGQGRKVAMDVYLSGDLMSHETYAYNEEGREISSTSTLPSGELQSRIESQWEGLTETRLYYSGEDTEPFMISVFTYDDSGNVVFEETRQGDTVINRAEHTYEPFEVTK